MRHCFGLNTLLMATFVRSCHMMTFLQTQNMKWMLSNDKGSIRIPAEVPGGVYGSLMTAGILAEGDFYYRYNDVNYRHFSYENWTYISHFEVSPELLEETRIVIEFEGLDTIATVAMDEIEIGRSNNMFVHYSFDTGFLLKANQTHIITVRFESPVVWSRRSYEQQLLDYEVPPKCVDPAYRGECHVNHIRKMQASFGWDWGPAFPNMGIWRPFRITGWKSLKINSVTFHTKPDKSVPLTAATNPSPCWKVDIKIYFDTAHPNETYQGLLQIRLGNRTYVKRNISVVSSAYSSIHQETFLIRQDLVALWWPNGYGEQPLYDLSVLWFSYREKEKSEKTVRVGFRTIELDQSFIDNEKEDLGRHFRIKVNGVTMFMKGSNWIPAHILPEEVTPEYTRCILKDAAMVHQNCIRVWGGGIYETETFYEAADELGILIWQDFMFACSMYPTRPDFLEAISKEVETQVKRLQAHPSILLWAGNNENEAALRGNWYGTNRNFSLYKSDYIKLYVDTVRAATFAVDEARPFIVSSPSNGIESEIEGYIAQDPYSNKYGDVHFYNYLKDGWDWKTYPPTRFASEFGFQSWPSYSTLKKVMNENDLVMNSAMMNHRQHSPLGNLQLLIQISLHFTTEECFHYDLRSFKIYIYLVQIHQAMAVKTETEFYRRGMSFVDEQGQGYTSGALYWQLNDIWQGASLSSIEYGGRWKMLHYFAAKFFSPVLLSTYMQDNLIKVSVANDLTYELEDMTLTVRIMSYLQMGPLSVKSTTVSKIKALQSEIIAEYGLQTDLRFDDTCYSLEYDPENVCFLKFTLTSSKSNFSPQEAIWFPTQPKYFILQKAVVKIVNVTAIELNVYEITVVSGAPALFVWLETEIKGVFSDNGFHVTEKIILVTFEARQHTCAEDLLNSIEITTLSDTFNVSSEHVIPRQ